MSILHKAVVVAWFLSTSLPPPPFLPEAGLRGGWLRQRGGGGREECKIETYVRLNCCING